MKRERLITLAAALLMPFSLLAQEPAKPAEPSKAEQAKPDVKPEEEAKPPEEAKTEEKQEAAAEESPVPSSERVFFGHIDVGYRWVSDVAGDFNTYRSIVNLGDGVRLNGLDLNVEKPGYRLFDTLRLQANNWGGDPYNTARMELGKQGKYRYLGSYSNIAYFNYLPSFANIMSAGYFFNQRAYDTAVRNFDNELQLFPGTRITPYVAYTRNTDYGHGITTLVVTNNNYPMFNQVRWGQDTYRGGIRADFGRSHLTVEHGATTFKDDQQVTLTEPQQGNRGGLPFLGQQLVLTGGRQAYGVRGDSRFTKVLFVANPYDWVDLYGQVLYANPRNTPVFYENTLGNLVSTTPGLFFYQRGSDFLFGSVDRPHTSGTFTFELRPTSRLRIRQAFETDRIKTDSSATLTQQFITTATNTQRDFTFDANDRFEATTNRETVEALFDISRRYTIRGGYRYVWGGSLFRAGSLNQFGTQERLNLERHVGLAGIVARPWSKVTLSADLEASNGVSTYYRTSLQDYVRVRAQGRYNLSESLKFNGNYSLLDNKNPAPGVDYKYRAQAVSLSAHWLPKGAKVVTIIADYTRSSIRSDIGYLLPPFYTDARSLYRDNAHTGSLLADIKLPAWSGGQPVFTLGGSFVTTSGSRPSRYYQPIGRVVLPVHKHVHAYSEWRWYELTQPFYLYEGFRTHMIMTGLRFIL